MAEEETKPEQKEGAATAESAPQPPSGKKKLAGIVVAVMVLEGVGVFGAMKMMGGNPQPTHADTLEVSTRPATQYAEVTIAKIRAPNVKDGKLVLWQLEVAIRVAVEAHAEPAADGKSGHGEKEEGAEKKEGGEAQSPCPELAGKIKMNEKTITDRLTRIVRSAEPQYLQEDGLETIRRQVKFELDHVLGEDTKIVEILIPECTPFPTGF